MGKEVREESKCKVIHDHTGHSFTRKHSCLLSHARSFLRDRIFVIRSGVVGEQEGKERWGSYLVASFFVSVWSEFVLEGSNSFVLLGCGT